MRPSRTLAHAAESMCAANETMSSLAPASRRPSSRFCFLASQEWNSGIAPGRSYASPLGAGLHAPDGRTGAVARAVRRLHILAAELVLSVARSEGSGVQRFKGLVYISGMRNGCLELQEFRRESGLHTHKTSEAVRMRIQPGPCADFGLRRLCHHDIVNNLLHANSFCHTLCMPPRV